MLYPEPRWSLRQGMRGDDVISWTAIVATPGDEGRRRHLLDRDRRRAGGRGAVDAALLAALGDDVSLGPGSSPGPRLSPRPRLPRPPVLLPRDSPRPPTIFFRCLSVLSSPLVDHTMATGDPAALPLKTTRSNAKRNSRKNAFNLVLVALSSGTVCYGFGSLAGCASSWMTSTEATYLSSFSPREEEAVDTDRPENIEARYSISRPQITDTSDRRTIQRTSLPYDCGKPDH